MCGAPRCKESLERGSLNMKYDRWNESVLSLQCRRRGQRHSAIIHSYLCILKTAFVSPYTAVLWFLIKKWWTPRGSLNMKIGRRVVFTLNYVVLEIIPGIRSLPKHIFLRRVLWNCANTLFSVAMGCRFLMYCAGPCCVSHLRIEHFDCCKTHAHQNLKQPPLKCLPSSHFMIINFSRHRFL